MEEKKNITMSLGTAICLIIIIILIFALGITYYFGFVKEDSTSNNLSKINEQNTVNTVYNDIQSTNTVNTNSNSVTNTETEKNTKTTTEPNNNADSSNSITNNSNTSKTKTAIYTYASADSLAAKGYPAILNIYEWTDDIIEFDYNRGWDSKQSTINRFISGVAKKNSEGIYEYSEDLYGQTYTITMEDTTDKYTQSNDSYGAITFKEYMDGKYFSTINLWS